MEANIKNTALNAIKANEQNPREIDKADFERLIDSLLTLPKMMQVRPIAVTGGVIYGGNMRYEALKHIALMEFAEIKDRLENLFTYNELRTQEERNALLDYWRSYLDKPVVPTIDVTGMSEAERTQFIFADNIGYGKWDYDAVANNFDAFPLNEWNLPVWETMEGEDNAVEGAESGEGAEKEEHAKLSDKFIAPPFTILDSRQGYWRERKDMWRNIIQDKGGSRENVNVITFSNGINAGISLFDPVLAECLCTWFTPYKGAKIFDCFAGDTQKGFVFAKKGFEFTGIELRKEQVQVNENVIKKNKFQGIRYICDDGQNVAKHIEKESQDLLFSCPPYYDLEVYSDNPQDASNQATYEDFIKILDNAYTSALGCLKNNRFVVVVVVGDVRNKQGGYYGFPDDVKAIFKRNGLHFYNEALYVEALGTLPQRVGNSMKTRKLGKCHQNVLVFYKGDIKQIKSEFAPIEIDEQELNELIRVE